jgi:hypothetical protein
VAFSGRLPAYRRRSESLGNGDREPTRSSASFAPDRSQLLLDIDDLALYSIEEAGLLKPIMKLPVEDGEADDNHASVYQRRLLLTESGAYRAQPRVDRFTGGMRRRRSYPERLGTPARILPVPLKQPVDELECRTLVPDLSSKLLHRGRNLKVGR